MTDRQTRRTKHLPGGSGGRTPHARSRRRHRPLRAAYKTLAPIVAQANGYFERADYKADKMVEGKAIHARLAPVGKFFLDERARLEQLFAHEKLKGDEAELALIERREGP